MKNSLWHRCFPVNFAKFLWTPFFTEHLWWLLLNIVSWWHSDFRNELVWIKRHEKHITRRSIINVVTIVKVCVHVINTEMTEAGAGYVQWKKVFWIVSQNSQKNTCASLFFNEVGSSRPAILLKKRLWHRCFPVNFVKTLRTPFLQKPPGECFWNDSYQSKN